MPDIELKDFRSPLKNLLERDLIISLFRECQPKILVVTDNLSFSPSAQFGLSQFVDTLTSSPIHGMLPHVTRAQRTSGLPADITGFKFDDPSHGVSKSRYDVVFLLGFDGASTGPISPSEVEAIAKFMEDGGGVFATGDHQDLGAAISKDIPRVRAMRYWTTGTPHVSNDKRLSTNMSGSNEVEDFVDQSDAIPQNLYPNFRTDAGNPGVLGKPAKAHPLLQLPATPSVPFPVLEVFPDHPHEGECHLPASLSTKFTLAGALRDEWPNATGTTLPVQPEAVAMTMSHGSGFPFGPTGPKEALLPRAFMSICAYDGQLAEVGRVVTDATWHHFVNVNLDGTGAGTLGLMLPGSPPTDGPALARIRQYYRNLATWLMPKKVRRCLRFPLLLAELARYPLFEELQPIPLPDPDPDPGPFAALGAAVVASLALREPSFVAETLLLDALSEAVGDKAVQQMLRKGAQFGKLGPRDLAHAALGATVISMAETLATLQDVREIKPHHTFEPRAKQHTQRVVRTLVEWQRRELRDIEGLLNAIAAQQ